MTYLDEYRLKLTEAVNNSCVHNNVTKAHIMSVGKKDFQEDYIAEYADLKPFDNVALADLEMYELWLTKMK